MQKTERRGNSEKTGAQERILFAAAELFAEFGYNGTTTRKIAMAASVNEVTIYRHYVRKRDLYMATLAAELQGVTLPGDLLSRIAEAPDGRSALASALDAVLQTLEPKRRLLRLVQYGTLEVAQDFDPIFRYHASNFIEAVSSCLEPWVAKGDLRCSSAKSLTLTLLAIVLSHHYLSKTFDMHAESPQAMIRVYADWFL
jgi:AcrR family transcriptional regulator